MTQHFTRNTVEVSTWCNTCHKDTPHRVAGGKLAYCIPCYDLSAVKSAAMKAEPPQPVQGYLFK
jgi:hypothetical protein